MPDTIEIKSYSIDFSTAEKIRQLSTTTKFSQSEIVNFILRRSLKLNTDNCKQAVVKYFNSQNHKKHK